MKLITLNIWQGRLLHNVKDYFNEHKYDLICLQELLSFKDTIPTWDLYQSLEFIKSASKLKNQYFSPTYKFAVMGKNVMHGNGILSKYPIANQQTFFTHGSFKTINTATYVPNTRNAQIVTIDSEEGPFTLVNHHGHREINPLGSELSLDRLAKLSEALKDIKSPLIVAGDFNLAPESEAIKFFIELLGLHDLTKDFKIQSTLNSLVTPYNVACDHIFINDQIKVKDLKVENQLLSDHKAVILEFSLM